MEFGQPAAFDNISLVRLTVHFVSSPSLQYLTFILSACQLDQSVSLSLSWVRYCCQYLCQLHPVILHLFCQFVRSCHVMSCHVMSCHVMICHVMSCHVMSCHVMSCHVLSCNTSRGCHSWVWCLQMYPATVGSLEVNRWKPRRVQSPFARETNNAFTIRSTSPRILYDNNLGASS